jgi:hypothetical protein
MPGSLGAQHGAEDTGAAVTMVQGSTILPGLTMDQMVMPSGLRGRERQRAGAVIQSPGTAINVVAASLCRGISDAATAVRQRRGCTAKRGNDGKGAKLVWQ